jgi:hypothetical protein
MFTTIKTIVFKRNPSGRTRIYEYAPPPIIASRYGPERANGVSNVANEIENIKRYKITLFWSSTLAISSKILK